VPHISLAMGVIRQDDLVTVQKILKTIAEQTNPLILQISKQYSESIPTGETVLGLKIKPTDALLLLHQHIMEKLTPYVFYDATLDELFDLNAEPQTVKWVNEFKQSSSGQKFWPHITVGISESSCEFSREPFLVSELAIFHLGTYCTCPVKGCLARWNLHQ